MLVFFYRFVHISMSLKIDRCGPIQFEEQYCADVFFTHEFYDERNFKFLRTRLPQVYCYTVLGISKRELKLQLTDPESENKNYLLQT